MCWITSSRRSCSKSTSMSGGSFARLGDEALEDHGPDLGRDGGHAQRVAGDGIRRRAAPLAEDAARPGEGDDVVDGQEIGLVAQLGDQAQLMVQLLLRTFRDALGVAPVEACFASRVSRSDALSPSAISEGYS
jgi:hypothetical protein